MWVDNNIVRNAIWDGIGALNWEKVHIRNNTVENSVGGIYVHSISGRPLNTVEISGNHISGTKSRPGIAIRAADASAPISDVAVHDNDVSPCTLTFAGDIRFRAGEPSRNCGASTVSLPRSDG